MNLRVIHDMLNIKGGYPVQSLNKKDGVPWIAPFINKVEVKDEIMASAIKLLAGSKEFLEAAKKNINKINKKENIP